METEGKKVRRKFKEKLDVNIKLKKNLEFFIKLKFYARFKSKSFVVIPQFSNE